MNKHPMFDILNETGIEWSVEDNLDPFDKVITVKTSEALGDEIKRRIKNTLMARYSNCLVFEVGNTG